MGPLAGWPTRLGFEASLSINTYTRLLTLGMRPHLPAFYLLGFPVGGVACGGGLQLGLSTCACVAALRTTAEIVVGGSLWVLWGPLMRTVWPRGPAGVAASPGL